MNNELKENEYPKLWEMIRRIAKDFNINKSLSDHFNHAIFTYDELNGGLTRFIQNGYAEELNSKYKITQKGSNFIKNHTSMFKGSIDNMFDLCDAIIKTYMEVDYSQPIISFSEYENIINKYK